MKSFKKLSTYFFTAVFFATFYPSECNWPNPGGDEEVSIQQQQIINTPVNELEITSEIA